MRKLPLDYAKPKRQRRRIMRWKYLPFLLIDSVDQICEVASPRSLWESLLYLLIVAGLISAIINSLPE